MNEPTKSELPGNITVVALVFEIGLAGVALGVGWLVGCDPLATVRWTADTLGPNAAAAGWGLLAAVPLLVMLVLMTHYPIGPLGELTRVVDRLLVPLFAETTLIEMLLISLAAGVGEEMLFRGLMQQGIAQWFGPPYGLWIALAVASVVFGACHWITTTYAVLATGIGLYLGWLFVATDNLLAPIVAHAAYDFVALWYLVKLRPRPVTL